ncbi:MAG: hypothetical protein HYV95_15230 [Opitutae bacterium]|nr:hypothetical protein [Opitutae bacterium]
MAANGNSFPLWLTLGFAMGLSFGWVMFKSDTSKAPPAAEQVKVREKPAAASDAPRDAGTLAGAEQTFQRWGGYAVWEDDATEIAVWNARRKRFSDFYEVRRVHGQFYFRTIQRLSRPFIDHGVRGRLPIVFTEPQADHDAFHRQHPDYDPASEPIVDLPPRMPEPFAQPVSEHDPESPKPMEQSYAPSPPPPPLPRYPALTPGAGL